MYDSHQFQDFLIQSKSKINQDQHQLTNKERQHKKQQQLQNAMKNYPLVACDKEFYTKQKKEAYTCQLTQKIQLLIVLNYDFPTTAAKMFANQKLTHRLIDNSTQEIAIREGEELAKVLDYLKNEFSRNQPEEDALVEEMNRQQKQEYILQLLANIEGVDLRTIFYDVAPNHFKSYVEGNQLGEYAIQLDDYQTVAKLLIEKAQKNENFANTIMDVQHKNELMKYQLQEAANYYENFKNTANNAHMQCETIKKVFQSFIQNYDEKELLRILDRKIQALEYQSADIYDKINENQVIDQKALEKEVKEYLEIRKQYQISKIKKRHFYVQVMQQQVKYN